jgi:hypothetical protein
VVLFRCRPSRASRALRRILCLLLLVLAVSPLATRAVAATVDAVPHLTIKEGEAQLKSTAADAAWTPLSNGDPVPYDHLLRVGKSFDGVLAYPDGTTLTVKPSTTLQVIVDGLRLYRGQTWIKVVKQGSGFRCITPSAIASVRGTKFSVEVPSIARIFHARYTNEFFNPRHLLSGLKGHLVATSIGLAILASLVADAPGGQVPVATKVFEGKVFVTYNNPEGAVLQSWLLTANEKVSTHLGVAAAKERFSDTDQATWHEVETAAVPAVEGAPLHRPAVGPRGHLRDGAETSPVRLLNETYDSPY